MLNVNSVIVLNQLMYEVFAKVNKLQLKCVCAAVHCGPEC